MTKRVTFVLNRSAFREQVLLGRGTAETLEGILSPPPGCSRELESAGDRVRVRVYDRSAVGMAREAATGHLSRALGGG